MTVKAASYYVTIALILVAVLLPHKYAILKFIASVMALLIAFWASIYETQHRD